MSNRIVYNGKSYPTDESGKRVDKLMSVSGFIGDALASEKLAVDTLQVVVRDYDTEPRVLASGGRMLVAGGLPLIAQRSGIRLDKAARYGADVRFYHDDSLLGKFKLEKATRIGRYEYSLSCVSAIGLLITSNHYGGIYNGETAAVVMADIVGGIIPYTLAPELASVPIYGYLRKASRRDNLRDLLFAIGGQIRKDSAGELQIVAMSPGAPYEITADEFYVGGSVTGGNPASEIRVTEHSYMRLDTDEVVTLYEGDSAAEEMLTPGGKTVQGVLVDFSDPMHDLEIINAEILESGVNYAVISGSPAAVLTGRKYTHTERIINRRQNTGGTPNVVTATACTLVNTMNSELVADRLMAYYGAAKTVEAEIVVTKQKPGDSVTFVDPFGDPTTGFISDMELTVSNILKARTTLIAGYIPTASGNYYSNLAVVSESGTFTFPAECKGKARIVLIGGGTGGEAGQNGANAVSSGLIGDYSAEGGAGGSAGAGGAPGKVFVSTIAAKNGQSFAVKIGAGGAGAQVGGTPGKGGATTFGSWTSEDGFSPDTGYSALLSDTIYATSGPDGIPGGHGDDPQGAGTTVTDTDGTVYAPGERGQAGKYNDYCGGYGGYGGGPAIRTNGTNGGDGSGEYNNGSGWGQGGDGGKGADAAAGDNAVIPGSGGGGGHGGGGGGACGGAYNHIGGSNYRDHGNSGAGGQGGAGGNGAPGVVLIYY